MLVAGPASAHDPFEITSDAHLDVYGLNVHTTLSLDSAARICLPGSAPPARRFRAADFSAFRAQFERCARNFYAIGAGAQRLPSLSVSLSLSAEDDLEARAVYARPAASPLVFDASLLKGLAPGLAAGVVLTVTGSRSFLGQKLLTPDDARLVLAITPQGEAVGTPPLPTGSGATPRKSGHLLGVLLLLAVLAVAFAWFARRTRR